MMNELMAPDMQEEVKDGYGEILCSIMFIL